MIGLYPEMERKKYDIDINATTDYERDRLSNLETALHYGWMASARKKIDSLGVAEEMKGEVYTINTPSRGVPTLGGYTNSLLWFGWGVVTYTENTLYVSPITEASGEKEYTFVGREDNDFSLPSIRKVPELSVDTDGTVFSSTTMRDERRIEELTDTLLNIWPEDALNQINEIKPSSGDGNTYVIKFETDIEVIETEDGDTRLSEFEEPVIPLGQHVDVLLYNGWAVSGIKTNSLFVGKLKNEPENKNYESVNRSFVFEGESDTEDFFYTPEPCERCELKEAIETRVIGEEENELSTEPLPVYSSLCMECVDHLGEKTVSTDEYYQDEVKPQNDFDF